MENVMNNSKIYAIADTHLSFNKDYEIQKPMDIFGNNWDNYVEKLQTNWNKKVKEEDVVVISGDISWGTYIEDSLYDFKFLNELNGKKIILKGNHDYWWTTKTKIDKFFSEHDLNTLNVLHNNSYVVGNKIIVGTRLWQNSKTDEDLKIINRENQRLELSILDGIKKIKDKEKKENNIENFEIICFTHYMPLTQEEINNNIENDTIKILKKHNVKKVYYGHLHGDGILTKIEGNYFGIDFKLISGDYLDFEPIEI